MADKKITKAAKDTTQEANITIVRQEVPQLFAVAKVATMSYSEYLLQKKAPAPTAIASAQGVTLGRKEHPFNIRAVTLFQTANVHHSTCIKTKVAATVGLGFRDEGEKALTDTPFAQVLKAAGGTTNGGGQPQGGVIPPPPVDRQKLSKVDTVLNEVCENSWQETISDVCEDFWQAGAGAMEVVRARADSRKVTGIHHIPIGDLFVYMEDEKYNRHYEVESCEGAGWARVFAKWGDTQGLIARGANGWLGGGQALRKDADASSVSEVIYFRMPSSLSRWYGFPDWLSAVTSIELIQCLHQYKYDFFLNRGVPEFILLITGGKLDVNEWAKVEASLRGNIGLGNSHKSVALNLSQENVKMQVEKLAMEGASSDEFTSLKECLALDIVSAHRVPPLLAGIQIPGKLGAVNELPNALMAFYTLVIAPAQLLFRQTLGQTLGSAETGLGLKPEDFCMRTIPELLNMQALSTVGGMRQDVGSAQAEGRDLSAGPKK